MFDLKLKNLTKKFDDLYAVDNVNFNIANGEFFQY